jgi:hypothetical protein
MSAPWLCYALKSPQIACRYWPFRVAHAVLLCAICAPLPQTPPPPGSTPCPRGPGPAADAAAGLTTTGYTCRTNSRAVPSVLDLIRGGSTAAPQPAASPTGPQAIRQHPVPPIAPYRCSTEPPGACPFAFSPWQPHPAPSHPREAACLVSRHGQPLAWWRREWVPPQHLPTYSPPITLEGYAQDALYTASGELIAVSVDPQSLLEHLASSL